MTELINYDFISETDPAASATMRDGYMWSSSVGRQVWRNGGWESQ